MAQASTPVVSKDSALDVSDSVSKWLLARMLHILPSEDDDGVTSTRENAEQSVPTTDSKSTESLRKFAAPSQSKHLFAWRKGSQIVCAGDTRDLNLGIEKKKKIVCFIKHTNEGLGVETIERSISFTSVRTALKLTQHEQNWVYERNIRTEMNEL